MRLVCQAMDPSAKDSETRTSSSLDGFIHHARRWRQVGRRRRASPTVFQGASAGGPLRRLKPGWFLEW